MTITLLNVCSSQKNRIIKTQAKLLFAMISVLVVFIFSSNKISATSIISPLLSDITIDQLDTEGCCFQLSYNYDGILGNIDGIETRILTPNVLFSSIQYSLASGWSYDELFAQRRLRWSYQNEGIPLGSHELSSFCFSGWNTSAPVELLVIWRDGNFIRQRDTIQINCTNCWQTQNPLVTCEADSSFTYTFDYVNLSEFNVNHLQIRESSGQDFIVEQSIPLAQSLPSGATATGLQLKLRSASSDLQELCFEITPRHLTEDGLAIECCTATYCVAIPICDRCCTDYLFFEEDVQQGFSINIDCQNTSVRLQANGLNECDVVRFDISSLGGGIVSGQEAVIFGGLSEDITYDVCMTVTRQDLNGENCYEEASLEICDQFSVDCDDCLLLENIDTTIDCPTDIDFVCACNGMTYVNECAAINWGGITAFEADSICTGDMPIIIEHCLTQPNESTVELMWDILQTTDFRYFHIQRRSLPMGDWQTIATALPSTAINFIDNTPLNPLGEYRVLGITQSGKVIFSVENSNTPCISDVRNLNIATGGKLWPNPVYNELHIELPIQIEQSFEIWNSTGLLLLKAKTDRLGQAKIEIIDWPSGYYYITAYFHSNSLWRKPFIVL